MLRLYRRMQVAHGFRLLILIHNDPQYRDKLIEHFDRSLGHAEKITLDASVSDFAKLEKQLKTLSPSSSAIHIVGFENWRIAQEAEAERFKGWNYHREQIAECCQTTLMLWLLEHDVKDFALHAPDMWAWRSDVLDFTTKYSERWQNRIW